MANEAKTVKVSTDYPVTEKSQNIWGVSFTSDGKKEAKYIAEVDSETAKSLIDAGRAKAVK